MSFELPSTMAGLLRWSIDEFASKFDTYDDMVVIAATMADRLRELGMDPRDPEMVVRLRAVTAMIFGLFDEAFRLVHILPGDDRTVRFVNACMYVFLCARKKNLSKIPWADLRGILVLFQDAGL